MNSLFLILKGRILGAACLSLLAVAIAIPLDAANLLDGQPVMVSRSKAGERVDWVAEIPFTEMTRQDLRLKVECDLKILPRGRVLSPKKPRDISDWTLNGQHLIQPPKDMFYPEL
jgi:hypothetical protein